MRRTVGTAGALALLMVGIAACGSDQSIIDSQFGWTVSEGLLLVTESDPTVGTVLLASTVGNCDYLSQGIPWTDIASTAFLAFQLESVGPTLGFLPLSAGTYTITVPSSTGATQPGLYGIANEYETGGDCTFTPTGANSGTLTLNPFVPDGGVSAANWTLIFGVNRFQGANDLTTCTVPATTPPGFDAGTCVPPGFP